MKHKPLLVFLSVLSSFTLGQHVEEVNYNHNIVLPLKPPPPPTCYDHCRETCFYNCKATNISELTLLATVKQRKKPRTELDLSFNNLKILKKNEISATDFKIVRKLYLEYNSISIIEEEALEGLNFLEELYLSGNQIKTFFKNSFDSVSLETLMLDSCGIKALPKGIFKNNPNLKLINLNNNTLREITNEMFRSVTNLEEIHLGSNLLSNVNKNTFEGIHNLKILNLTNNGITQLEKGLFENLYALKEVYLASNLLKEIDVDTFKDNHNLISVNFANNFIETIQEGIFEPTRQLRSIKFNNNKLTTLKMHIFQDLINNSNDSCLRVGTEYVFDLENNPWDCQGCDMSKVFHWLRENTTQDYHFKWSVMICESPERFKDKSWTLVPWDENAPNCVEPPSIRNVTETAEVDTRLHEEITELPDAFPITPEGFPNTPDVITITHEVKDEDFVTESSDLTTNVTNVRLMEYIKENSNLCVFQYYFLGSYALFVLFSACTVWVIIYKEKIFEMHEERFYD